jgi:hypothetical protein
VTSPQEPQEPSEPAASSGRPLRPLPGALAFVGLGTSAAGCVAVGVLLGILVDARTHTSPLFLVVGLVLGVVGAVSTVVSLVRRYL